MARGEIKNFHLTEFLIGINIWVFIITSIFPQAVLILAHQPLTAVDTPWTIITSMFVHADYLHLFMNMIFLFLMGRFLEQYIGSIRFIFVYFFAGILSTISDYLAVMAGFHTADTYFMGVSGAIFGIEGALVILLPLASVPLFRGIHLLPVIILFLIDISLELFNIFTGTGAGVAHIAHLSGLFAGMLFGLKLRLEGMGSKDMWEGYSGFLSRGMEIDWDTLHDRGVALQKRREEEVQRENEKWKEIMKKRKEIKVKRDLRLREYTGKIDREDIEIVEHRDKKPGEFKDLKEDIKDKDDDIEFVK